MGMTRIFDIFLSPSSATRASSPATGCARRVKSGVYSEPEVISLGSLERGKPVEKTMKLISAENERFHVSLSNKPESCSVEVREGKGEATLDVTIVPETPGILQGEIELRVQRESETSDLVVKYIGYVR